MEHLLQDVHHFLPAMNCVLQNSGGGFTFVPHSMTL